MLSLSLLQLPWSHPQWFNSSIRWFTKSNAKSPFRRPSGGAVDIIVVQQRDGSLKCSPWYVRFGKFQSPRKLRSVGISVNNEEAKFRMLLNPRGDVYFLTDSNRTSFEQLEQQQQALDEQNKSENEGTWYRRRWYSKNRLQRSVPTTQQLASLRLKEGRNSITFKFATRVFGEKQIEASIFLLNWDAKLVISDVDGTITKSDVLGHVMPLVGRDWSQTGVARLLSAIRENGYHVLFLSARAISQARRTRAFLENLVQDGEKLPEGPVVISSEGIFPCLYREVVRRTPHEFKIRCLKEIKSLFPPDVNPFYAGFGNRSTDVVSYLEVGILQDKIFTINPQGELVAKQAVNVPLCYTSLHKLVDEKFPPLNAN